MHNVLTRCLPKLYKATHNLSILSPLSAVTHDLISSIDKGNANFSVTNEVITLFLKEGVNPNTSVPMIEFLTGNNYQVGDMALMLSPVSAIIKSISSKLSQYPMLTSRSLTRELPHDLRGNLESISDIITLLLLYGGRFRLEDFVTLKELLSIDYDAFIPFMEIGINASPNLHSVSEVSVLIKPEDPHHDVYMSYLCNRSLMQWCRPAFLEILRPRRKIKEDIENLCIPDRYKLYLSSLRL